MFVPGMVVPAAGWSPLFLGLVLGLFFLSVIPGWFRRSIPQQLRTVNSESAVPATPERMTPRDAPTDSGTEFGMR